jgi:NADPH:quinone reductase-like Zn-dependent oxidoreductase
MAVMTLKKRILLGLGGTLALALASLAVAISHTQSCGEPAPLPDGVVHMQAIMYRCYGGPEVLQLEKIPKPTPADDEVLVRVHAAAVNPLDWHEMRGEPYVMRLGAGIGAPNDMHMGVDFAGTIEAIGQNVTRFKVGDAVFGGRGGAFGEYVVVREDRAIVKKPDNATFEQAAALPIAAVTALQALRDRGQLRAGQKVLINGASGGVGTFAVQIAKSMGAEVTAVCSTRNVQLVQSLGADRVIDYTREDFTRDSARYDLIVDNVGNHSLADIRGVLQPDGRHVIVGTTSREPWLGPLATGIRSLIVAPFVRQKPDLFMASLEPDDLSTLATLVQAGKLTSVIDRRFPLHEASAAIAYLETGRARGKVILTIVPDASPRDTLE